MTIDSNNLTTTPSQMPQKEHINLSAVRAMIKRHKFNDTAFSLIGLCVLIMILLTLLVLFTDLVIDGHARLNLDFLSNYPSRHAERAGLLSAWVDSLLIMLVCFTVGVPMGVSAGLYLEEYAPKNWFSDLIEINVSNLAGVPSIIYGLLALSLFSYILGLGNSILTAGLTLSLLIIPIVIVSTREAIRGIPIAIREAAYAVGATKWQVVYDHVIKYSYGGILTGVIIGMARALGETAPLITIGAATYIGFLPASPISTAPPFINFEWLQSEFTAMPIQMFNWLSRPDHAFQVNAAATGAIIIIVTLLMNGTAIYLRYKIRKNIKW